ncbi:MAG: polyphosphate kinase 1 [Gammaproteobacteria bacterium]|nr:MAG: polyphosphate kinase 1 [Gammaproteobacteria bacterium]
MQEQPASQLSAQKQPASVQSIAKEQAPEPANDKPTTPKLPDLKQPDLYINRELSLLKFNIRVLEQSQLESVPLLERLRYLCIACTNLDEFFEVRVSGVKQKAEAQSASVTADGMTPSDTLQEISKLAHELVKNQYDILNDVLIPELEKEDIRFIRRRNFTPNQEAWVHKAFYEELLPILTPIGLDPSHPFPRIINKSLNFIVSLKGKDAFGRIGGMAVVQAPRSLPRIFHLPADEPDNGPYDFVFLSSIIHSYVDELFPGMEVTGCYQFRITRNSDLFVDEEEVDDLLRALEGELLQRRYGDAVRLEVAHDCPDGLVEFLRQQFELEEDDVYQVNGPVNLNRMSAVCDMVNRPDLKFKPFTSSIPPTLSGATDIFQAIQKQDILLHHPFESFAPVIDFLRQAAKDPQVLAIKQTLYRSGPDSAVVDALAKAAEAGKEVTVIIELRARFDEAANIALANKLQKAGAHVVYGIVGYKTHAKIILVIRREGNGIRRYVHLGTGNYHARTARLYTDYGLLTADKTIGDDAQQLFMLLTSPGKTQALKKLLQSPFTLHQSLWEKIRREKENALAGKPARIIAKMNSLVEPKTIRALYNASIAGVKIDLIVRGLCCLRPGVPGVSENIRVISVIGRFLEHTRINYFENGGNPEVYGSSADWMDRNLFWRVELGFPIESPELRQRVIDELYYYLKDNTKAWELENDGCYVPIVPVEGDPMISAQQILLEKFAD